MSSPGKNFGVWSSTVSRLKRALRRAPALTGTASEIVPLIKVSATDASGPAFALPANETPVTERLIADLLVLYGFDRPRFFSLVTPHDCAKLGTRTADLRSLAVANLRRRLPQMKRLGNFPAFMLTVGGNYEASLLLLEEIWEKQKQFVPGELVAAVPSREVLVYTGSESPAGIGAILGSIDRTFQKADHLLSRKLLVWREKRWSVYQP